MKTHFTDPSYLQGRWDEYLFVFAFCAAQIFCQTSSCQGLTTMDIIGSSFGATQHDENWFRAAVPFAMGTLVLASGRIGDVYGHKKIMLGGYCWTILWSVLGGVAYYVNVNFFIFARAMLGAGLAFMIPNMMGIAGIVYKPQTPRKNLVFGLFGASAPTGGFLGAFFDALIVHYSSRWDISMYVNAFCLAIAGAVSWYIVPSNLPINTRNVGMDWIGAFLGVASLTLFSFAWNQAAEIGFDTSYIIVTLVLSIVCMTLFTLWEAKWATYPLIPPTLLKANKLVLVILGAMILGWGSFGIWLFSYFRFELEFRGYGSLHAAWTFWPNLMVGILAACSVGFLFRHVKVEYIFIAAMLAFTVPCILLSVAPIQENWWRTTFGAELIIGFGMDLSFPASSIVMSDLLPLDCQGISGSLISTITGYSQSIFLGMGSVIESEMLKRGSSPLAAFRSSLYFAIGLSAMALIISVIPVIKLVRDHRRANKDGTVSLKSCDPATVEGTLEGTLATVLTATAPVSTYMPATHLPHHVGHVEHEKRA